MTQMVPVKQKIETVRTMLERLKPQIALALPKHMTPERMSRVAMTCILRTPKLLDCDPTSLAGAIITCSQLGLEPDPMLGHAHLVPFWNSRRKVNEVVVIPGYRGLMKLARNSGEVSTIDAHVVHVKDQFTYAYGLQPQLRHVPYQGDEDPGPSTHYYALCRMKDGGSLFHVMTHAEVEQHKSRFVKNIRDDSPWISDFDAMALKTCLRQLTKFMPASVETQRAATLDEHAEAGVPQDLASIVDTAESNGGGSATLDRVTQQLEAPPPASAERALLLAALEVEKKRLGLTDVEWTAVLSDAWGDGGSVEFADLAVLTDLLAQLKPMAAKGPAN
jgi:recombination protein RecT